MRIRRPSAPPAISQIPHPATGQLELARFLGPVDARDREVIEHWRRASAGAHAKAMVELARYAERMARQTGLGKGADEMFPGFAKQLARRDPSLGGPGR